MKKEILDQFNYNQEYIRKNILSEKKINEAEIDLVSDDEVFVRHPQWSDYFISQYGRAISVKKDSCRLLGLVPGGGGYYYFKFCELPFQKPTSISVQRAVADIYCPNFWQDYDKNKLQAHHYDHNKINNYYRNLILLPTSLHFVMNKTKKMAYFSNSKFREMNPYQIMEETNLTLNEIILSSKKKPLKSQGKWSIFEEQGYLIGFQFKSDKKKGDN